MRPSLSRLSATAVTAVLLVATVGSPADASAVPFTDCLNQQQAGQNYFVPTLVQAFFTNPSNSSQNILRYEVTGTVVGPGFIDLDVSTNMYTTLYTQSKVLQYQTYEGYSRFCEQAVTGCPFGPQNSTFAFEFNVSDALQAVSFDTTFTIIDPTQDSKILGCVSTEVTPTLPGYIWYLLIFLTLALFILFAAVYFMCLYFNPWTGTSNLYLSTSNFNRADDAIRLITPGAFDFLRYLQFAFLTASLNLNYPGFFTAVMATFSWSSLLFGTSFVIRPHHTPESSALASKDYLHDNLYAVKSRFGMGRMAKILQLQSTVDVWPSFIVWLVVVGAIALAACGVFIAVLWLSRKLRKNSTDLRARYLYFLAGVVIRLGYVAFALPIMAFTFFQLLISRSSHVSAVAEAFGIIVMIMWVGGAGALLYRIFRTNPKRDLYDDLSTLLCFGPLYNTYLESKHWFFALDLGLTFMRGLTIGALQNSGLAQITLLATMELAYCIAVASWRPFAARTNMNIISITMSVVRLIQIFLMLPFVAFLGISAAVRGWLGYVILLIHALVIILWFVHAIQVIFEVVARMSGAGGREHDASNAYGMKALENRRVGDDQPEHSPVPLLIDTERAAASTDLAKSGSRSGSRQGSGSAQGQGPGPGRRARAGRRGTVYDELFSTSPSSEMTMTMAASGPVTQSAASAGYYRRPRRRLSSHDWAYGLPRSSKEVDERQSMVSGRLDDDEEDEDEEFTFVRTKTDYAVRESDVYYTKRASAADELYRDPSDEQERDEEALRVQSRTSTTVAESDEEEAPGGLVSGLLSRMSRVKESIGRMRGHDREPVEQGFEVVRRPLIINRAAEPEGSAAPGDRTSGQPSSRATYRTDRGSTSETITGQAIDHPIDGEDRDRLASPTMVRGTASPAMIRGRVSPAMIREIGGVGGYRARGPSSARTSSARTSSGHKTDSPSSAEYLSANDSE